MTLEQDREKIRQAIADRNFIHTKLEREFIEDAQAVMEHTLVKKEADAMPIPNSVYGDAFGERFLIATSYVHRGETFVTAVRLPKEFSTFRVVNE